MKKWVVIVFLFTMFFFTTADATVWMTCSGNDGKTEVNVDMLTGTGMDWEHLDREVKVQIGPDEENEITIPKKFVEFYRISEDFVALYARGFDGPKSILSVFFVTDDFEDRRSMIEYHASGHTIFAKQSVSCSY